MVIVSTCFRGTNEKVLLCGIYTKTKTIELIPYNTKPYSDKWVNWCGFLKVIMAT